MLNEIISKIIPFKKNRDLPLKEDLETALESAQKGTESITKQERLMLLNILKIDQIKSNDIMIPRADIRAVEINDNFEKVLDAFIKESHSRVPVYEGNLDNIIGMIHIKDLVKYQNENKEYKEGFLKAIKRDVLEMPQSMPVLDLLIKMQLTRLHMGIVIDEYGCTDGLITIEDVIEEITGEIEDEHDKDTLPMLLKTSNYTYEASARLEVDELEKIIKTNINSDPKNDDIETLGGLVFALAGRVPQRGEVIKHDSGITFEIKDADPKKIKLITIRIPRKLNE